MIPILIVVIAVMLLFLFSLRGRRKHPLLRKLRKWKYAHRGLHGDGVPENSMRAFSLALENGYGIELDIHLMADGDLAVIHDSSLKRTAGADVRIEDLTAEQLPQYPLEGTTESVPTFRQVLDLFDGKAPLIVELKTENGNYGALTEAACKMLADYKGLYCMESFDPRCIRWLKMNRPEVVRGQLAHNSLKDKNSKILWILRFLITNSMSNFWNAPDFIAYHFPDRNRLGLKIARRFWGIQGVAWTLRNQADFDMAVREDWIPIFEGFRP